MQTVSEAVREQAAKQDSAPVSSALLSVDDVAAILNCSSRHVRRLADSSRMPAPIRLSTLIRWRQCDIDSWLADGCPRIDPGAGR